MSDDDLIDGTYKLIMCIATGGSSQVWERFREAEHLGNLAAARTHRALVERHHDDLRVIITATNSFVTAPIAREFGIAELIATEPEERDGEFTGAVRGVPCFREGKLARLEDWLAGRGGSLAACRESWFYSDSHNDLPLLEPVKLAA